MLSISFLVVLVRRQIKGISFYVSLYLYRKSKRLSFEFCNILFQKEKIFFLKLTIVSTIQTEDGVSFEPKNNMRIRKEITKWSIVMFAKVTSVLLALFNFFYLTAAYLDQSISDINPLNWLIMCILYPIMLSAILNNGFRKGILYINEYENIADFDTKIKSKILKENMVVESETRDYIVYKPKNWIFKIFNAWQGSEKLAVRWGTEVVIEGSLKKINNIEDILNWNKDFK